MKRAFLVAAITLATLAALAPTARGGTYRAIQCLERLGAGHADASFHATSSHYRPSASCAGRGLGVTHDPRASRTGSGRFGAWTITTPAGTDIVRASALVSAARESSHVPQMHVGLDGGAQAQLPRVEGTPHTVGWSGTGGRYLTGRLTCSQRQVCGAGQNAHIYMRRIAFTLQDETAPRIQLGGTLLDTGSRRGDQMLEVNAIDSGGGVRSVSIEVNGAPVQARVLDCHLNNSIATRLRPCPESVTPQFEIATDAPHFRQGPNLVRVCVSDFAPQATANRTCETRIVRVDNECPLADVTGAVVRAHFKGGGDELAVPSDSAVQILGEVVDASGNPVRGARVCIATRVATAQAERVVATPATGPDGRFNARLDPGPSREVRIAHWRGQQDVAERFLELESTAVPRLEIHPRRGVSNGESVRFDVRVPRPFAAKPQVAVEAKANGRWIRILSGRVDRGGRWNGSYRFRNTTGTRRYAFRAVVARQRGYPYLAGTSPIRHLKVSGRSSDSVRTGSRVPRLGAALVGLATGLQANVG